MNRKAKLLPRPLVAAIGSPADSTIDLLKKLVLLGGNLGGYFFSIILISIYFLQHLFVPAVYGVIYLTAVTVVYIHYFRTKQLNLTATLFSSLLFVDLVATPLTLEASKPLV